MRSLTWYLVFYVRFVVNFIFQIMFNLLEQCYYFSSVFTLENSLEVVRQLTTHSGVQQNKKRVFNAFFLPKYTFESSYT